ncbi:MAG: hypothetical protein ACLQBX_13560 [Candidatus Limnocylindrales bacterium]
MGGIVGIVVGIVAVFLVPAGPAVWWVVSLVPGFIAFRLWQVPEGYSPARATGFVEGIWAVWFWGSIIVALVRLIGLLASGAPA